MSASEGARGKTAELVERIALELVTADPGNRDALARLGRRFEELAQALAGSPHAGTAQRLCEEMRPLGQGAEADPASMRRVGELFDELARALERPVASLPPKTAEAGHALRDAETVELFAGFVAEGAEGLDQADQILLGVEHEGTSPEQINALFRVFHTLKGVSGFLGADDVTRLAHSTETLLGRIREGTRELAGRELDVIFDASALMRRLVESVRTAVEADTEIPVEPATEALIARIEGVLSGEEPVASALVQAVANAVAPLAEISAERERDAEAAPQPREGTATGRMRETVKVDLDRIDSVVEMIGELIIVESMIVNSDELAARASPKLRNYLGQLAKISRDLQNVAMRMRMVAVRGVFHKMARLVRDLAQKTKKPVRLAVEGEATEMDRSMVERIEEPLVHMIRNSIDHAIESAEERRALGKPEVATLRLSARHEGGSIVIELSDDGRGLQREAILKKARSRGLVGEAVELGDAEVHALIFLPGFSTAAQVSELSGRGVGMDVVKRGIEALRGRVMVSSSPGVGTTFRLMLPLTLAIIDGMLVSSGGERYIVPSLSIVESLQPTAEMIHVPGGGAELIDVRGEILPLIRLEHLFSVPGARVLPEETRVVVVEGSGRKMGLVVDEVLAQQQVVIKPLSGGVGDTELLSGAAIMSDGRVGLILNIDRLGELFGAAHGARRDVLEKVA